MIELYTALTIAGFIKGGVTSFKKVRPLKSWGMSTWAFVFGGAMCAVMWPFWVVGKTISFVLRKRNEEKNRKLARH